MELDALEPNFFENIKNEIFDMVRHSSFSPSVRSHLVLAPSQVRPKDPFKITLADILASGQGAAVTRILTDVAGFGQYENRESG